MRLQADTPITQRALIRPARNFCITYTLILRQPFSSKPVKWVRLVSESAYLVLSDAEAVALLYTLSHIQPDQHQTKWFCSCSGQNN